MVLVQVTRDRVESIAPTALIRFVTSPNAYTGLSSAAPLALGNAKSRSGALKRGPCTNDCLSGSQLAPEEAERVVEEATDCWRRLKSDRMRRAEAFLVRPPRSSSWMRAARRTRAWACDSDEESILERVAPRFTVPFEEVS